MEEEEKFSEKVKRELEILSGNPLLSKEFRQKKLLLWLVRTFITTILYVLFWDYSWVRWSLVLTVPLNLFSLVTIVGAGYFLKRKIDNLKNKLKDMDPDI